MVAKNRSRLMILHHICEFSLAGDIGGRGYAGLADMRFHRDLDPVPGDLVALQSAPPSKHYLSWVVDVGRHPTGDPIYGLESIEDGEVVNWSNIGVAVYNRERVANHPEWRWTDDQWDFKDRWFNACYKKRDAYIRVPLFPIFHSDGGVTLAFRTRFGMDDERPTRTFSDWRRVLLRELLAFYDECNLKKAD